MKNKLYIMFVLIGSALGSMTAMHGASTRARSVRGVPAKPQPVSRMQAGRKPQQPVTKVQQPVRKPEQPVGRVLQRPAAHTRGSEQPATRVQPVSRPQEPVRGEQPAKVGIKSSEIEKAKELAKEKGHSQLYALLGGTEKEAEPFTETEIREVLWPVLVWAIEEGNKDLVRKILFSGIRFDAKKPYGQPLTPLEIATYHKQKGIVQLISGIRAFASRMTDFGHDPKHKAPSTQEQIKKDPWTWLAAAIELGDMEGVQYIIEKSRYIGPKDLRSDDPNALSYKKTPIDIAKFNANRSRERKNNALAARQDAIVAYLESFK